MQKSASFPHVIHSDKQRLTPWSCRLSTIPPSVHMANDHLHWTLDCVGPFGGFLSSLTYSVPSSVLTFCGILAYLLICGITDSLTALPFCEFKGYMQGKISKSVSSSTETSVHFRGHPRQIFIHNAALHNRGPHQT